MAGDFRVVRQTQNIVIQFLVELKVQSTTQPKNEGQQIQWCALFIS